MSDVDTSAEAVGRAIRHLMHPPRHRHEEEAAALLCALLRERDEARAALAALMEGNEWRGPRVIEGHALSAGWGTKRVPTDAACDMARAVLRNINKLP